MNKSQQKPTETKISKTNVKGPKNTMEKPQNEQKLTTREDNILEAELELKEIAAQLNQQQVELSVQRSKLLLREQAVEKTQQAFEKGFPEILDERFRAEREALDKIRTEYDQKQVQLVKDQADLLRRESELVREEARRDSGYAKERKTLEAELAAMRRKEEENLVQLRSTRHEELEKDIEQERVSRLQAFEQEIADVKKSFADERQKLVEDQIELETEKSKIGIEQQRLESREASVEARTRDLDEEVELQVVDRRKSFEAREASLERECEILRESIRVSDETKALYEQLEHRLGGENPREVLSKLDDYAEELKRLETELIDRPTKDIKESYKRRETELNNIIMELQKNNEDYIDLVNQRRDQDKLQLEIEELTARNQSLQRKAETIEADNVWLNTEFGRLKASYEREQDREARIRDLRKPVITTHLTRMKKVVNELDWLSHIQSSCLEYGLKFPKRILYAFHTALKTAEWSPLTVLAGVSGTGKSLLPDLYAHFGGLKFLSLAVQPNWDSQESMLGFFNSIDNNFDAQPVLRLLAQTQSKQITADAVAQDLQKTEKILGKKNGEAYYNYAIKHPEYEEQKKWLMDKDLKNSDIETLLQLHITEYPGLEDVMTLILLDEMNLAHIELYFADFLSTLESRRGKTGEDIPALEVKLGSKVTPYQLMLGRNVLWAGTMNQDETTKSLSDKVTDRGIEIHFPRPQKFERRIQLKKRDEPSPLLPRKVWENWWSKESRFTEAQIAPFKTFVEDLNENLAHVGRALGHRVWQSIEYYMANYPTIKVLEEFDGKTFKGYGDENILKQEMKIAFEDQLVQKIMPKMRGIETRGQSKTECLDRIRTQLVEASYNIVDDFDIACKYGYGQFMWNSAKYLDDTPTDFEHDALPETKIPEEETQPKDEPTAEGKSKKTKPEKK